MMASGGARPSMKGSADESEPPTSTSAADAVQGVEESTKRGRDGPSNRSGSVLVLHDENVLPRLADVGAHHVKCDARSKEHRGGVVLHDENVLARLAGVTPRPPRGYQTRPQWWPRCASCGRMWRTRFKRENLSCQWCEKGPLCDDCRLGAIGHQQSCILCVEVR